MYQQNQSRQQNKQNQSNNLTNNTTSDDTKTSIAQTPQNPSTTISAPPPPIENTFLA